MQLQAPLLFALLLSTCGWPVLAMNNFYSQTGALLGSDVRGTVAAIADVNADRLVDLIVINQDLKSVDGLIMVKDRPATRSLLAKLPNDAKEGLVGVIGADFNGDSRLDLALVSGAKTGAGPVTVYIAYGTSKRLEFSTPKALPKTFTDQPALIDFNSDMIADLLGETSAGKMTVYIGQASGNFTTKDFTCTEWAHPGFTGFVDLNNDNQPDILYSSKKKDAIFDVAYKNSENTYDLAKTESIPAIPNLKVIGKPVFQDFNDDGNFEILVPGCVDADCGDSKMFMYSYTTKKWETLTVDFSAGADTYSFMAPSKNPLAAQFPMPLTVHSGDINGDGYPDLLTILTQRRGKGISVKPTSNAAVNRVGILLGSASKKFSLVFPKGADSIFGAGIVVAFDFKETGNLGILTVEGSGSDHKLSAFLQGDGPEYYFLKVMVLSGLCGGKWNCPDGLMPYGLPVPGPSFVYDTERPEGGRQVAKGAQITQTSYFALQPPYHVFGLGTFANYIESMSVYLPNPPKKKGEEGVDRQKTFTFIVPKTQLVVVPYPLDQPSKTSFFAMEESVIRWKSKLFLEPFKDKKVLFVAAALLGTIVVVAITIGILQWRERREDIQEKLQDAQKFHFDAM